MAATAVHPPAGPQPPIDAFERMMITFGIILAAFMQVLDLTIANVTLPHMQTSLGATSETITWVLTSYIVASAITIPITGWLADKIGRKTLFLWSIVVFTVASALCAIATNLPEMVMFRILQGVSGAFILPITQAVLFDINPPERHARAMALFTAALIIGPVLGPLLGGWLTDNFNWRWVFILNLPIGLVCTLLVIRFMPRAPRASTRFDLLGFALLALSLGALQLMFDRGQQEDWFHSWEIRIEAGLALGASWMFLVHMFTSKGPLLNPQMFADRNFSLALVVMIGVGVLLLGGLALLPPMLQHLLGYSVQDAGLLSSPRGLGTLITTLLAGRLLGKVDARILVFTGMSVMALSTWQMMGFSLDMDSRPIIVSGFVQGLGMGLVFVPINYLAFATLPPHFRTSGASMVMLSRNVGGSIGISMATTLMARTVQISHSDLASHITPNVVPFDPALLGTLGAAGQTVTVLVDAEINRQAAMIAYINDFYMMFVVSLACLPLALLLKMPKRQPAGDMPILAD